MNWFVSFLIPSLLGCKILEGLTKEKMNRNDFIFYYLFILLFTNTISVFICHFLFGLNSNLEASLVASPIFSVKYVFVSIIISAFLGFIITIFKKYVSVSLEVIKNEKKKNK